VAVLVLVGALSAPGLASGKSPAPTNLATTPQLLAEMRQRVVAASQPLPPWNGPKTGPAGKAGRLIAIICEDLRNGGILGVAQGIHEAAKVMGWRLKVFDATGTPGGREKAAVDALAAKPEGLILVGADAKVMQPRLLPFAQHHIPIVGWHVGPKAGAMSDSPVAINVSTDPLVVAEITAMAAVVANEGKGGVVIFTDSNFEIATTKANAMARVIRTAPGWTLLEVRDVPISQCAERLPTVMRELLGRHGQRWTHALAINDIYFDYAVPELIMAGPAAGTIRFLSAGDGSAAAFMRIQTTTFQVGTVAEPLNLHGWQLVDELNRRLENQPVSGYVVPVHLVTPENIKYDGGPRFLYDPDNGYRDVYRQIWGR
jgi:ribose transport system substrate-binding protein